MKRNTRALLVSLVCILSVVFLSSCGHTSYWQQKVSQFRKQNKTFEKGQIIFIGDSITDGYDLNRYYGPHNLSLKTYNRGINGDTTAGVLDRMDVSLFDLNPSKIVILIGINDLNSGKSSEYVVENYREILSHIKTRLPQCKVYIQSIYPVNGGTYDIAGSTDRILQVNAALVSMAGQFGYVYIDIFPHLATAADLLDSSYANDGLHPNQAGYEIITELIVKYLKD